MVFSVKLCKIFCFNFILGSSCFFVLNSSPDISTEYKEDHKDKIGKQHELLISLFSNIVRYFLTMFVNTEPNTLYKPKHLTRIKLFLKR